MDKNLGLSDVKKRRRELDEVREHARKAADRLSRAVAAAASSGNSQRAIAQAAGVSQPYVAQLLRARSDLDSSGPLGRRLAARRDSVLEVFDRHGVRNVAVFGSVADGSERAGSDIDLLVDIPAGMGLFALSRLEKEVADLLQAPVDLVPRRLLRPEVRTQTLRMAVPL